VSRRFERDHRRARGRFRRGREGQLQELGVAGHRDDVPEGETAATPRRAESRVAVSRNQSHGALREPYWFSAPRVESSGSSERAATGVDLSPDSAAKLAGELRKVVLQAKLAECEGTASEGVDDELATLIAQYGLGTTKRKRISTTWPLDESVRTSEELRDRCLLHRPFVWAPEVFESHLVPSIPCSNIALLF